MTPTHPQKRRPPEKTITLPDGTEQRYWRIQLADEIAHTRHMVAEVQEIFIRSGISEGFLSQVADLLVKAAMDAKDFTKLRQDVVAIGQNLQGRLGMMAERRMYIDLACCYWMAEDEPVEMDEDWQARKRAAWRASGEEDFFTCWAFRRISGLDNTSMSDIIAVCQAAAERIAQLPNLPT